MMVNLQEFRVAQQQYRISYIIIIILLLESKT